MALADSPQYRHIHEIRQDMLGQDADGNVRVHRLARSVHAGAEHLSEGLYHTESHFILELIQNAEDNEYAPDVVRELAFHLTRQDILGYTSDGTLIVVNNELGFQPNHVDAICDLGRSTKSKQKGYIGEKGIGFKSVFVVSAYPHIFSAGYQFRFQEQKDPEAGLGFIYPYWVADVPPELARYAGMTVLVLPLKEGQYEKIAHNLASIAPETILFLDKLDKLTIEIEGEEPFVVSRDRSRQPVVRLEAPSGAKTYWLATAEVAVPPDVHEDKREGVETRHVSVALPMEGEMPAERVYAYLPTDEVSGLPFLLNADFILGSAREAIQHERPWNRWLMSEIGGVFVSAFLKLLKRTEYRRRAYAFVPTKEGTQGPYQEIREAIIETLSTKEVVMVTGSRRLRVPATTRLADKDFRDLFGRSRLPLKSSDLALVDAGCQQEYDRQLKDLGVKNLQSYEILECLEEREWLNDKPAAWFVQLYGYLAKKPWATLEALRTRAIILVESGELFAPGQVNVYFPLASDQGIDEIPATLRALIQVEFLKGAVVEVVQKDPKTKGWLTSALGVRTFSLGEFCVDLATTLNKSWRMVAPRRLVQATRFICHQWPALSDAQADLIGKQLPLLDQADRVHRQSDEMTLVTPEALDPEDGWQWVFPHAERMGWTVLSDNYLTGHEQRQLARWREFFSEIGASSSPMPRQSEWDWWYAPGASVSETIRQEFTKDRPQSTRSYKGTDTLAPGWLDPDALNTEDKATKQKRALALLKWLEHHNLNSLEFLGRLSWFYRKSDGRTFPSTLKTRILNAPWMPTTQGYRSPGATFVRRRELTEIFGDTLPYALVEVSPDLQRQLVMRTQATANDVLGYLEELAREEAAETFLPVVRKIYAFLAERLSGTVKERFKANPLILVTQPQPRWLTTDQVIWPDYSDVFGDAYGYLDSDYDDRLRSFFVRQLGVRAELDGKLYADAWLELAGRDAPDAKKVEIALERIYPVVRDELEADTRPLWAPGFLDAVRVWTKADQFVAPADVFIQDDAELEREFQKRGVQFVWSPAKEGAARFASFYHALGVRSLVATVSTSVDEPASQELSPSDPLLLLTPAAKRAIVFFLANRSKDAVYERVRADGLLEDLLLTSEVLCEQIEVEHVLEHGLRPRYSESAAAYWEPGARRLYRVDGAQVDQIAVDLPLHLARKLTGGREYAELENFIGRILGRDDRFVESIVRRHSWALPADIREWVDAILDERSAISLTDEQDVQPAEPPPESGRRVQPSGSEEPYVGEVEYPEPDAGDADADDGGYRDSSHFKGPVRPPTQHGQSQSEPAGNGELRREHPQNATRPRGRKTTYGVREQASDNDSDPKELQDRDIEIEAAAIDCALTYERDCGREPVDLNEGHPNHEGWDIDSYEVSSVRSITGSKEQKKLARRIEVKGKQGAWDGWGIGITRAQHAAMANGEDVEWYLYVVEYATDPERRRLYAFRNLAEQIDEYRFDDNWKLFADEVT